MGSDDQKTEHQRAVALVEDAIKRLGIDPATARGPADARSAQYQLRRGSARIVIAIHAAEGAREASLRVAAPVIELPDEARRLALYHHVLELNAKELVGAAFGIAGSSLLVVAERSIRDLDGSEVDSILRSVGRIADTYDDALASRFGAKRSSD